MKFFKRTVSIALVLMLALTLFATAFAKGNAEINIDPEPKYVPVVVPTPAPEKKNPFITDDHFAYITGYPDNTFKPEGSLSRAEAATIFYRLLKDKSAPYYPSFSDVKVGSWYETAVSTLAGLGVINGYPDNTFKPDNKVTRAEFLKMAACFFDLESANVKFTDVPEGKWFYQYIASAVAQKWIDNLPVAYKPNEYITRAEVVAIVNNILGREADADFIAYNYVMMVKFTDVDGKDPYFLDVMEASNAHDFKIVSGEEIWTALYPVAK